MYPLGTWKGLRRWVCTPRRRVPLVSSVLGETWGQPRGAWRHRGSKPMRLLARFILDGVGARPAGFSHRLVPAIVHRRYPCGRGPCRARIW